MAPRSEIFSKIVQAVGASQRASGGDPDLAGRLPRMFLDHGLEVREIRPILRVARPGDLLWQWPATFFRNYVLRGGFRDGKVGLIVSAMNARYVRMKFAKLWELCSPSTSTPRAPGAGDSNKSS